MTERYIINLDPHNILLKTQDTSYGRTFQFRDFFMNVTGCKTIEQADNYIIKEIERRGWQFREKWWQFWRPKDFREPTVAKPETYS